MLFTCLLAMTAASVSGFGWRGSSPRHRPVVQGGRRCTSSKLQHHFGYPRRSFGAAQLASGTPLSAGALPLSENVDMSMVSKSRWRGGAYRGYRGGYRGYRGGYRGYRGGYRGYRGVRAYGYRYGYRPYRRYGAVGTAAGYGGCGPYSYYDRYSGVCRPSGGYYGARGVYGARSTVAGDTPTGDIAAATVAVCTGDGRSPCGAGTAGASPAAEDRQRLISNASFEPLPSAMESRQGPEARRHEP